MNGTVARPLEPVAPLTGVRALEIGAFMAAPFGTMQLADLGADVIKVENPDGGDPVRTWPGRVPGPPHPGLGAIEHVPPTATTR
ncbi:CoA transferase [Streptomyces sp. NPDC002619]|uniref:CoA transferase n=1 Tax=Streptomyces sp. NPDC002619 TaxID=3364655 RepID=UPI003696B352